MIGDENTDSPVSLSVLIPVFLVFPPTACYLVVHQPKNWPRLPILLVGHGLYLIGANLYLLVNSYYWLSVCTLVCAMAMIMYAFHLKHQLLQGALHRPQSLVSASLILAGYLIIAFSQLTIIAPVLKLLSVL